MAGKLAAGKRAGKKPVSKKTADPEAPTCCEADWTPSFNETTVKAMEDVRAGRNLTRYADADELFEKMGIKVGKAKAKT
jgi:hypothetical protein